MKKWVAAIALAGVAGVLLFFLLQSRAPSNLPHAPMEPRVAPVTSAAEPRNSAASNETTGLSRASPNPPLAKNSSSSAFPAIAPRADRAAAITYQPQFTNIPPAAVLDNMRITFHQYASMFGGNPVGTNPEITAALNGNNPKQANFIKPEAGMRINDGGELVDPWGTPYFFHQLSGTVMEIHSAGPDRVMWTADDLVIK
jgi:hypothetical protein